MNDDAIFSPSSFLWGLQAVCKLQGVPIAPEALLQEMVPPYTADSLLQASLALGLKAGARRISPRALPRLSAPYLAVLEPKMESKGAATCSAQENRDIAPVSDQPKNKVILLAETASPVEEQSADNKRSANRLALILRCEGQDVHLLEQFEAEPTVVTFEQFAKSYTGMVLLFVRADATVPEGDGYEPGERTFGFKWFVPELLKHKSVWRNVLLASLAIQLLALSTPVFTQIVIDKVIVHHTMNTLIAIAVGLFAFMVFTAGLSWVRQYLILHTGNRIDAVLGSRVFERLLQLPVAYFERRPTGTLVARVQGVETIREFIASAAVTLILDVPFLLVFIAIMFYYSWLLTVITLAVLLLIAIVSVVITPRLRERINNQFLFGARNQAFLTEYIAGIETVKSLQMEPHLNSLYGDYFAAYLAASFRSRQLSNTYNVVATTLEQFLTLAILCVGAWLVMTTQSLTIGMLVAFQMFASRLSGPMLRMVGLWQQLQQTGIAVKRLGDIMNTPAEPYSLAPAREGRIERQAGGRISIEDVSFRYAEDRPWLYRHFDLVIEPGQSVALMGASGTGKSTLARMMQGFCHPSEGSLKIDGYDTRHLPANELRRNFGVVPQDTTLFSGTIYTNLVSPSSHVSMEQVIAACRMAEIHDVIEQLPRGYQTEIGEHGAGLSGGQKQRIAIARALLKRPNILIFDEATSSLDPPTAEQFARTVNKLKGKVTMLFIAHQLPKGLQVDRVVTLGQGPTRMTMVSE